MFDFHEFIAGGFGGVHERRKVAPRAGSAWAKEAAFDAWHFFADGFGIKKSASSSRMGAFGSFVGS